MVRLLDWSFSIAKGLQTLRYGKCSITFGTLPKSSIKPGRYINIEIDRNILQVISDSLVHLVRNDIGHGLEPETERLQKGKTAEGNLLMRAYNEKDFYFIPFSFLS